MTKVVMIIDGHNWMQRLPLASRAFKCVSCGTIAGRVSGMRKAKECAAAMRKKAGTDGYLSPNERKRFDANLSGSEGQRVVSERP